MGAAATLLVLVALRPLSTRLVPFATPFADDRRRAISDSNGGSTRTVAVDVRVRDPSDLDDVTSALPAL